jgi:hypothetical protein
MIADRQRDLGARLAIFAIGTTPPSVSAGEWQK